MSFVVFTQIPFDSGSGGPDNFSVIKVLSGETEIVPENQEMVITQDLIVLGDLMVNGLITQLADPDSNSFFWSRIPLNKSVSIPEDRVMFYKNPFNVLGTLLVLGDLMEVA